MNNCKLSIVISCYNAEATINKCINSVFNALNNFNGLDSCKIIVINDGSNDKTLDIINQINGIKIINHDTNLGISATRNSGIYASDSDYIIFVDSDVLLTKNWITNIFLSINKNDDVVGVTVVITNTTTGEVVYSYGFPYQETE